MRNIESIECVPGVNFVAIRRCRNLGWLAAVVAVVGSPQLRADTPQGTGFTYQGQLELNNAPANGGYDFQFRLYDANVAGNLEGGPVAVNNVTVTNGLFTTDIDFGSAVFNGDTRWLDISVRTASVGGFTTLTPRQRLSATPYALALHLPLAETTTTANTAFSITSVGSTALLGVNGAVSGIPWGGFDPAVKGDTNLGNGVFGFTSRNSAYGVFGYATGTSSSAVVGENTAASGRAGYFFVTNSANPSNAVEIYTNGNDVSQAISATHNGLGDCGLFEISNAANVGEAVEARTNGGGDSIYAYNNGTGHAGYFQIANVANDNPAIYATSNGNSGFGIYATINTGNSTGIYGQGLHAGVEGVSGASGGFGVYGHNGTNGGEGVRGSAGDGGGAGVAGYGNFGTGVYGQTSQGYAVYGSAPGGPGYAGYFNGKAHVNGVFTANNKQFKIDHPLDPANKYLVHNCVESTEMKNIYDGVAVLDANGEATVTLPNWFEALNHDFRYQLTCIGGFAQVYVAEEITGNTFKIAGGRTGLKVSWQVTGNRHDAFAVAHPTTVEESKAQADQGKFLNPELFGQPEAQRINGVLSTYSVEAEKATLDAHAQLSVTKVKPATEANAVSPAAQQAATVGQRDGRQLQD